MINRNENEIEAWLNTARLLAYEFGPITAKWKGDER